MIRRYENINRLTFSNEKVSNCTQPFEATWLITVIIVKIIRKVLPSTTIL